MLKPNTMLISDAKIHPYIIEVYQNVMYIYDFIYAILCCLITYVFILKC